jgi:hypothetical protein
LRRLPSRLRLPWLPRLRRLRLVVVGRLRLRSLWRLRGDLVQMGLLKKPVAFPSPNNSSSFALFWNHLLPNFFNVHKEL